MANFSFVVDSSYDPMSLQEMMLPWTMYKEAYDKQEETYLDLINKADKFKYLSETLPENSRARQIYEGYANDLSAAASDFGNKGLTMGSRSALFGLRKRYQGEIGRLTDADERRRETLKARSTLANQGVNMIYANENPTIDDFLDGNNFNTYGVSSEELYKRGAELGKAISSRQYNSGMEGSLFGGLYEQFKKTVGIDPRYIGQFMNSRLVSDAVDQMLIGMGAAQNLANNPLAYQQAKQAALSGLFSGIVYTEDVSPLRNPNVLSATEKAEFDMKKQEHELAMLEARLKYQFDDKGNIVRLNTTSAPAGYVRDPVTGKLYKDLSGESGGSKGGSSSGSGSDIGSISKSIVKFDWPQSFRKGDPEKDKNDDGTWGDYATHPNLSAFDDKDISDILGEGYEAKDFDYIYEHLPFLRSQIQALIGDGSANDFDYFYRPYSGSIFGDTEASLILRPRKRGEKKNSIAVDENSSDLE